MRRSLLAATLLAGMGFACGREPTEGGAEATPKSDSEAPHAFDPDARGSAPQTTIEVLDVGAEPRELLRYAERAPKRTLELTTTSIMDGGPIEGPMLVLRIAWTSLEPEGEQRRHLFEVLEVVGGWVVEMPGRPPGPMEDRVAQGLRQGFEQVAGQASSSAAGLDEVLATRGMTVQPDPALQLQQFAVPLPSEPIGVGATWTRTAREEQVVGSLREKPQPPEQDGPKLPKLLPERTHEQHFDRYTFTDVERYTLVAREGDLLTIEYALTSQSEDPASAPGSSSSGRMQVSLGDPLARSGSVDTIIGMALPEMEGEPREYTQFRLQVGLRTLD